MAQPCLTLDDHHDDTGRGDSELPLGSDSDRGATPPSDSESDTLAQPAGSDVGWDVDCALRDFEAFERVQERVQQQYRHYYQQGVELTRALRAAKNLKESAATVH